MYVKICGITEPDDARMVIEAGASAIGLNFVAGPRQIDADRALRIIETVPDGFDVWLLADVGKGELPQKAAEVVATGRVSHLQMYGAVSVDTIKRLSGHGLRTVAVRHVTSEQFADETDRWLEHCGQYRPDLLLLDAVGGKYPGGTGRQLDWSQIAQERLAGRLTGWPPIVLAGGLSPNNVAEAIELVQPWGVDVSSGVERTAGHKDAAKVSDLVRIAKSL